MNEVQYESECEKIERGKYFDSLLLRIGTAASFKEAKPLIREYAHETKCFIDSTPEAEEAQDKLAEVMKQKDRECLAKWAKLMHEQKTLMGTSLGHEQTSARSDLGTANDNAGDEAVVTNRKSTDRLCAVGSNLQSRSKQMINGLQLRTEISEFLIKSMRKIKEIKCVYVLTENVQSIVNIWVIAKRTKEYYKKFEDDVFSVEYDLIQMFTDSNFRFNLIYEDENFSIPKSAINILESV